jgi:hypothetical protein
MSEQEIYKEKEIHMKCCAKLIYNYCSRGTTVIRIGTAPDRFFVTLQGSVLIFIPRDANEVKKERKVLEKFLSFT